MQESGNHAEQTQDTGARGFLNALIKALRKWFQVLLEWFVDFASTSAEFIEHRLKKAIKIAETSSAASTLWSRVTFLWGGRGAWVSGIVVLALVVFVVLQLGDIGKFLELVVNIELSWLVVALLLQAATYGCAASVWYLALKQSGQYRPMTDLIPLGVAKLFIDQTIPSGGLSGTVMVMAGLTRRGIPLRAGAGALLLGLVSYYTAYLLAVVISLGVLAFFHAIHPWVIVVCMVFSVVAVGIPAAVLWLRDATSLPLLIRLRQIPGLDALLKAVEEAPFQLLKDPVLLAQAVFFHVMIFLLDGATLWVMLYAIGQDIALSAAFSSFVIASVAATLGPIPLGFGTFEGVSVAMLMLLGSPLEAALTATLLLRGFTLWLPMLPGVWLVRREAGGPGLRPPPGKLLNS